MNDSEQYRKVVERIRAFCDVRDWSQFHDPKNLAISLNLESAEVLELFQWTKDNELAPKRAHKISEELADVFYWLIMLANHYDIDLIKALEKKMEENEQKYPEEKSKGKSDKYSELD